MPILGVVASGISGHLWAPSQDYVSISTATVTSGGQASITFSSIPTTYTHLQIRGIARENAGGGASTIGMSIQFNGDSGTNYTSSHVLYGNGTSALAAASAVSQTSIQAVNYPQSAATTSAFGVFVIDSISYVLGS